MDCSVAQCLEVVGDWWTMLIVRDTFLGVTRFEDFQRRLGISRNILQQRLTKLVDAGVLVRVPYSEHPPRYDYRLTAEGPGPLAGAHGHAPVGGRRTPPLTAPRSRSSTTPAARSATWSWCATPAAGRSAPAMCTWCRDPDDRTSSDLDGLTAAGTRGPDEPVPSGSNP